jgi:AraC-like DNA-binding protein
MERGVWLGAEALGELCGLVREAVVCQGRLLAWLERNGAAVEAVEGVASRSALARVVHREVGGSVFDVERGEDERRREGSVPSREVARAVGYIHRHYGEFIGLTRVARHVGCSRTHLARVFRKETGRTMRDYLQQVRLTRAVSCLREGDKVEAVMLDVGYRSKANFRRLFKARLGAAPGVFKAKP